MDRFYRVIKKDAPSGETAYVIYQVYYDEQGNIELVSADPASPSRETIAELKDDLERIRQALDLPALEVEDVLNSLEASGATAYGKLIREQIRDSSDEAGSPVATRVSHEEVTQAQQQKLEMIAAIFAEKCRNDPSHGL